MPEVAAKNIREIKIYLDADVWAYLEKHAAEINIPVDAVIGSFVQVYAEQRRLRDADLAASRERKLELANPCHHP